MSAAIPTLMAESGVSDDKNAIPQEALDIRYFRGAYADQISEQLWTEIKSAWGCAHWWSRPVTPTPESRERPRSKQIAVKCGRCCGVGAIASFSIRSSGVCFACGGSGFRLLSEATYNRRKALAKATVEPS